MAKIENLLKQHGFNPSKWEPKPSGRQMEQMLSALKHGNEQVSAALLRAQESSVDVVGYGICETGVTLQNQPYTIYWRVQCSGEKQVAIVYNQSFYDSHPDMDPDKYEQNLITAGRSVPEDEWFNPKRPM